jgi:hypothetical protein
MRSRIWYGASGAVPLTFGGKVPDSGAHRVHGVANPAPVGDPSRRFVSAIRQKRDFGRARLV